MQKRVGNTEKNVDITKKRVVGTAWASYKFKKFFAVVERGRCEGDQWHHQEGVTQGPRHQCIKGQQENHSGSLLHLKIHQRPPKLSWTQGLL